MFKTKTTPILTKLEFSLKGKKFVTGDKPVFEDFAVFESCEFLHHFDRELLDQYPSLVAHYNNVRVIP